METPQAHANRLEREEMTAIDDALNALDVLATALLTGDAETAALARARAHRAWATFGELIINRADQRTASMLLQQLKDVEALVPCARCPLRQEAPNA
jgi:hypothetical protein